MTFEAGELIKPKTKENRQNPPKIIDDLTEEELIEKAGLITSVRIMGQRIMARISGMGNQQQTNSNPVSKPRRASVIKSS